MFKSLKFHCKSNLTIFVDESVWYFVILYVDISLLMSVNFGFHSSKRNIIFSPYYVIVAHIEDLSLVVIAHEIMKWAFYKFHRFLMKWPQILESVYQMTFAGLGGSVGCAVRLETRRSRVQPPPRSATFFRGDWSWNIFFGHSLPSADSRRAVVSFWRKNVHNTG